MQLASNALLLLETATFSLVALLAGEQAISGSAALLRRASGRQRTTDHGKPAVAASLLVGFGVCAFVGMVLAIAHLFYWWVLVTLALVLLGLSLRRLGRLAGWPTSRRLGSDVFWVVGLVVIVVQIGAMFLAALAPPTAFDELAYHLPEAQILVSTHALPLNLGGHFFFGNIPKLFEVLFAEGIALHGFALAHLLHAAVFAAFIWTTYCIVRGLYGPRTAILAAALITTLPAATTNAESMQIDTGTTSFEIGALLLTLAWLERREVWQLAAASLLAGFALGGKYSSAPTICFSLVLLVFAVMRSRERSATLRVVATAAALTLAVAGYWYLKNAVRFGNPVYPLYLGHKGVSNEDYASLLAAIQQFGPRTLHAFIHVPALFPGPIDLPAFLTFAIAPFALLVRRRRIVSTALGAYFVLYVPYWFFVASQQVRFLFAGLFVGAIAAAVALCAGGKLVRLTAVAVAVAAFVVLHPSGNLTWHNFETDEANKLGSDTSRYAIGAESQDDVLARVFGCSYRVSRYLPQHGLKGGVVDDWSQWFGFDLSLYRSNAFGPLPDDVERLGFATIARGLRRQDIHFLYVDQANKDGMAGSTDPIMHRWWLDRRETDAELVRTGRLIYRSGDCSLYRLPG